MLAQLCAEAVQTVKFFEDPSNWASLDATKDLWAAAVQLRGETAASYHVAQPGSAGQPHSGAGTAVQFGYYIVQAASMTIGEIATAVYGDTTRAIELLQLNAIEDAFSIPRNTQLRYVLDQDIAA